MNDSEFNALTDMALKHVEASLDESGADVDCSMAAEGVLEIEFADRSKIIVNRHAAAQEMWVAARSGGYHFRWDGNAWLDTRNGSELLRTLSELVSTQAGEPITLG
jgi:CyaY protein